MKVKSKLDSNTLFKVAKVLYNYILYPLLVYA